MHFTSSVISLVASLLFPIASLASAEECLPQIEVLEPSYLNVTTNTGWCELKLADLSDFVRDMQEAQLTDVKYLTINIFNFKEDFSTTVPAYGEWRIPFLAEQMEMDAAMATQIERHIVVPYLDEFMGRCATKIWTSGIHFYSPELREQYFDLPKKLPDDAVMIAGRVRILYRYPEDGLCLVKR